MTKHPRTKKKSVKAWAVMNYAGKIRGFGEDGNTCRYIYLNRPPHMWTKQKLLLRPITITYTLPTKTKKGV